MLRLADASSSPRSSPSSSPRPPPPTRSPSSRAVTSGSPRPTARASMQVTRTGTYSYVSQADDGTMIALAPGERLHKLSRTGAVLADFTTYVSDGAPRPAASPSTGRSTRRSRPTDSKVAFEWFNDSPTRTLRAARRRPSRRARSTRSARASGSRLSSGYTGPEAYGLMTGWIYPHWLSNDTLLRSFSGAVFTDDAVITLAPASAPPRPVVLRRPAGLRRRRRRALARPLDRDRDRGLQRREAARLSHLMSPFGAPDWNHQPFYTGNSRSRSAATSSTASSSRTTLAPGGRRWPTAPPTASTWRPSPPAARPATAARCWPPARASRTGARPTSRRERLRDGDPRSAGLTR